MSITAIKAQSIQLSHTLTESGVYYLCNVREVESGEKRAVDKNVTTQFTKVKRLLPDTAYRVDCVAYHSDGVEYCLEANTTITTRELHLKCTLQNAIANFNKTMFMKCRSRQSAKCHSQKKHSKIST